ncbi:HPr-rel-A system PqqD family peptide chaperone [Sphingomonas baiyangensis]|uniref:HPr-rel-A system PqqD family peptide chaperone n=1 Tax=Sphingomonas baiyangensis TaxID=2572576 RepID=A0A4U1L205_9SPHN|nr:HPr-rel-A system PqqD family peptide chaperone [Sphingomonas baiyangensis]TKD50622.1 HPr-rel-A system PqqD family peptide chaperone [Sphingomonas baiyangensis]
MPATRYRAAPAATLSIVSLDLMRAVYHRASGRTHLVSEPVPEILAALADEPLDEVALLDRLARDYAIEGDAAALGERLEELVATGLVEQL